MGKDREKIGNQNPSCCDKLIASCCRARLPMPTRKQTSVTVPVTAALYILASSTYAAIHNPGSIPIFRRNLRFRIPKPAKIYQQKHDRHKLTYRMHRAMFNPASDAEHPDIPSICRRRQTYVTFFIPYRIDITRDLLSLDTKRISSTSCRHPERTAFAWPNGTYSPSKQPGRTRAHTQNNPSNAQHRCCPEIRRAGAWRNEHPDPDRA